ncbi:DsbA family protein [Pseudohoeflea coraliihabitans]|uniref:DsbA family protein n=1 Tax=Pseudohoeflea coraliihabitans TaxID=2860393 RepID=A0ABS6WV52_9HYPH|nr:DsbA family protein [Pseudohoeflea sp. DP4N28-3]MBW3098939.1 DsbA family protein [Pseudohoeflea sp. DP4N28-3]
MLHGLIKTSLLALALSSGWMLAPAVALEASEKSEIETVIRDYLLSNPEILEEMQMALQAKQEAEAASRSKAVISENSKAIFDAPGDVVLGNPDGDVTVVEFFDYNCGYCKAAMADMDSILEEDKNVRFVLKEFPILGPDSMGAHMVAMSFRELMPEKYGEFHRQLLGGERANEDVAVHIATALGADESALRAGMQDPAIKDDIREAYRLSDALGIRGTPSYVIGDETVFGAVGVETLEEKIANLRRCDSTVC